MVNPHPHVTRYQNAKCNMVVKIVYGLAVESVLSEGILKRVDVDKTSPFCLERGRGRMGNSTPYRSV